MEIKRILLELTTKITPTWVKGHYEGDDDDQIEYTMNRLSHSDAVHHRKHPPNSLQSTAPFYLPSSHIITVYNSGDMVTSKLPHSIRETIHYQPLKEKILKDTKWTEGTFQRVDWDAFGRALHQLPRCNRISVVKLSNSLWNTNHQNNKYYNTSATCPCCNSSEENLMHVFSCNDEAAAHHRAKEKQSLVDVLTKIKTPEALQLHLLAGLHQWESGQHMRSPSKGSVFREEILLTNAFVEQTTIGWENFLKGHITTAW
jgi:hypothetical protein